MLQPGGVIGRHVRAVKRRQAQAPAAKGLRAVPAVASPVPIPVKDARDYRVGRGVVQPRVKHVHLARLGVGLHVGDPTARSPDIPAAQQARGGPRHVVRVHDRRAVRVVAALHGVCSQVQPVVRRVERHVPRPKVVHRNRPGRAVRVVRGDGVRRHWRQVAEVDVALLYRARIGAVDPDKVVVRRVQLRRRSVAPDQDAAVGIHDVGGELCVEAGRVAGVACAACAVRARSRAHGERAAGAGAADRVFPDIQDVRVRGPDADGRRLRPAGVDDCVPLDGHYGPLAVRQADGAARRAGDVVVVDFHVVGPGHEYACRAGAVDVVARDAGVGIGSVPGVREHDRAVRGASPSGARAHVLYHVAVYADPDGSGARRLHDRAARVAERVVHDVDAKGAGGVEAWDVC